VLIINKKNRTQKIIFSNIDDEIRIAVLEEDKIEKIFFEERTNESVTGNIYLGYVENIVPALEAAFVRVGYGKNAFLRLRDIKNGDKINKGSKVMVQVIKDPIGQKGPQVTINMSLAGRTIVYTPHVNHIGVSRKIVDKNERKRLAKIARDNIKEGGLIIRTASEGISERDMVLEIQELLDKWKLMNECYNRSRKVKLLYEDPGLVEYTLRELLGENTFEIVVDSEDLWHEVVKFIGKFKPGFKPIVRFIEGDAFIEESIYEMMKTLYVRKVPLEKGGNIFIDTTEALTVIDVNSAGNITCNDISETSFETNMEAAKEIVRHIKLRNLSGIIIIDFIDMKREESRRKIIDFMNKELKKDKAKTMIMGFTKLGLLELTRKRSTPRFDSKLYITCPICKGIGKIESPHVTYQKILKDISKVVDNDISISKISLKVYQNLSGILTPDIKKQLVAKYKTELDVSFLWPTPSTYDVSFERKKVYRKLKKLKK
jgi:ribonuclease G